MSKIRLDRSGVKQLRKIIKNSISSVVAECGKEAYKFLLSEEDCNARYTGYFRSNWNCTVNSVDTSVAPEKRDMKDFYFWDVNKANDRFGKVNLTDRVNITNSVPYVKALNDGGSFEDGRTTPPRRFLELCHGHIASNIKLIIKNAEKSG